MWWVFCSISIWRAFPSYYLKLTVPQNGPLIIAPFDRWLIHFQNRFIRPGCDLTTRPGTRTYHRVDQPYQTLISLFKIVSLLIVKKNNLYDIISIQLCFAYKEKYGVGCWKLVSNCVQCLTTKYEDKLNTLYFYNFCCTILYYWLVKNKHMHAFRSHARFWILTIVSYPKCFLSDNIFTFCWKRLEHYKHIII